MYATRFVDDSPAGCLRMDLLQKNYRFPVRLSPIGIEPIWTTYAGRSIVLESKKEAHATS